MTRSRMFGRLLAHTEQEDLRGKLRYLTCRLVGHRIVTHPDVGHRCTRCLDTMPRGFDRWQP